MCGINWVVIMAVSLTELRANLFKLVDQVIASGKPLEIERHGVSVKIVAAPQGKKLGRLKPHHNVVNGELDDIVHMDWSTNWDEDKNL